MNTLLWTLLAFALGSLPFSVWVGQLALRVDIRRYGDHNPGASNVLRAGGWQWAVLALVLDMLKGGLPVGLSWFVGGVQDWALLPVAVAPVLGHAYSPLLNFRGGKALAVSMGVWGGLTGGEAALVLAICIMLWFAIITVDGWAAMLTGFSLLFYLLLTDKPDWLLAFWAANAILVAWKHRADLRLFPTPRPGLVKLGGYK